MRHEAIINIHPTVKVINGETDAWDKDGNVIVLNESAIITEEARLQAEYDALSWKRSREAEYPSEKDLVVALYDTDDKSAIEAKRAAVKAKYPKDNSRPIA